MPISALTRLSHTGQKFSEKNFCKGVQQSYFELSLLSLIHKIFEQNVYHYVTVYLGQILTLKNVDKTANTFCGEAKRKKTDTV